MNSEVRHLMESRKGEIEEVCDRYGVAGLSVFGSALGETFNEGSDLDLLVEFLPGRTPGFAFARLKRELSGLLGREVDLHTRASLSRYFRDDVVRESMPVFDLRRARA